MEQILLASWLIPVLIAPFVGSLLGVVIQRLPTGRPLVLARSRCAACRRPLGFFEMLPLIS
ncbi:MAG: prepilin peptidase, partial [Acetobacteraceae bacterium]